MPGSEPLQRDTVTAASRIMLPTYVVFFGLLGINYLAADQTAQASPPLVYVDDRVPLPAWGAVFLTCAAVMAVSLLLRRRTLYRYALWYCGLAMVVWMVGIAFASKAGEATPFAWVWAYLAASACFASDRSLGTGEK